MNEAELLEFALDGMEGPLRATAEAHLIICKGCREQVALLLDLHLGLATLAEATEVPASLRQRVLDQVRKP